MEWKGEGALVNPNSSSCVREPELAVLHFEGDDIWNRVRGVLAGDVPGNPRWFVLGGEEEEEEERA